MKVRRIVALTCMTVALMAVCAGAQEIPAPNIDSLGAGQSLRSPFSDKSRVDPDVSRPDDGADGLIDAARYAFSVQAGIGLEDMSSGTTQLIGPGSDNDNSALAPIGFLFRYDGAFFTDFGVNSNGFLKFGPVITGANATNSISSATNGPKIMPYWDDLCVGSSGKVHYKRVGTGESEKLVVEWKTMKSRGSGCDGTGAGIFQIWLFARSGLIQFVYGGGMFASAAANGGYSIGIQSGSAVNFASVTTISSSVSYSTPNNTQFDAIPAGTSYLFSPNIPAAPSGGNATGVTQSSVTVNWTDNASDESAYLVRRTTDHVNFYFVGNVLAPNSTSFTENGLNPGTQYFYYINTLSEGAFSPDLVISATTNSPANISSTVSGGLWSAPSTWNGGLVPDVGDNITIPGGATVTIDTAAAVAGNVTVVNGASLRFGEAGAFKLTVGQDLTIAAGGAFSTGNGNANQHILSVGGNLTNNGTLDFSTNNNQAGAGIVFTGASSNTFGGGGPVTDIRTITVNKGNSAANIIELSVSNFTVQGTTTDGPASGYLFLTQGTFKISGTFTSGHRTFASASYQISAGAGFWLNNPNYTVTPQNDNVSVLGALRVSAGTYNVGSEGNFLKLLDNSITIIEGGKVNTGGPLAVTAPNAPFTYRQSGGTVTTCTVAGSSLCFDMGSPGTPGSSIGLTGGDIVIQKGGGYRYDAPSNLRGNITGANLRFGNSLTGAAASYTALGLMPNIVLDTTAGTHLLTIGNPGQTLQNWVRNVDVGADGFLDLGPTSNFFITGETFVNNGTLRLPDTGTLFFFGGGIGDFTHSGAGTTQGFAQNFKAWCHSLTLGTGGDNIRLRYLEVNTAQVINAFKLTLGTNSVSLNRITMIDAGALDSAPVFDLGTGPLDVYYYGSGAVGPEIPPTRAVRHFLFDGVSLDMNGGDLTITGQLALPNGVVHTGASKILHTGDYGDRTNGYVDGTITKRFTGANERFYTFPVGKNGRSPLGVTIGEMGANIGFITVSVVDEVLPGLLPSRSVSRYWKVDKTANILSSIAMTYRDEDVRGTEANYEAWFSNGGTPVVFTASTVNPSANSVSYSPLQTGDWGIGEMLDPGPVSVSGLVTTSAGNPIRNATVTISGGGLPAPVTVFTGSLGTYVINGLQAGNTYTVQTSAKRYRFPPGGQQVTPFGNVANVNFAANPQEEF